MKEANTVLAEIVKKARGNRSQRAFAKELGVSYTTVQLWEQGKSHPDVENLAKIAKYSGLSLQEVYDLMAVGEVGSIKQQIDSLLSAIERLEAEIMTLTQKRSLTLEDTEKIRNLTQALQSLRAAEKS